VLTIDVVGGTNERAVRKDKNIRTNHQVDTPMGQVMRRRERENNQMNMSNNNVVMTFAE